MFAIFLLITAMTPRNEFTN